MLCILFLLCGVLSDDEIVERLGSNSFGIRQKATDDLYKRMPYSYEALCRGTESEDLEIKERCKYIIQKYCIVDTDKDKGKIPGIWHLANHLRFPNGVFKEDVSKTYYEKARIALWNQRRIDNDCYRDPEIEKLATRLYTIDLLLSGKPRGQVKGLLDNMCDWKDSLQYSRNSLYEASVYGVPPPAIQGEPLDNQIPVLLGPCNDPYYCDEKDRVNLMWRRTMHGLEPYWSVLR